MKPSFLTNAFLSLNGKRQLRASSLSCAFGISALTMMVSTSPLLGQIYWDNSGGTANDWGSVANWSTVVAGGTNPGAIPGSSDVATFSATPIQGTRRVLIIIPKPPATYSLLRPR
jgi:hypothetical protein